MPAAEAGGEEVTRRLATLMALAFVALLATLAAQEPILITPADTTISSPGLKVYTTFLGIPCGDAFPMPGCLPPEMQGWLVQIEGGTMERFEVSFTWRDEKGVEHTEAKNVPRAAPYQGKPSFTAIPFPVGRAKNAPWFPVGTEKVRTVVAEYTPKPPSVVEHGRP